MTGEGMDRDTATMATPLGAALTTERRATVTRESTLFVDGAHGHCCGQRDMVVWMMCHDSVP